MNTIQKLKLLFSAGLIDVEQVLEEARWSRDFTDMSLKAALMPLRKRSKAMENELRDALAHHVRQFGGSWLQEEVGYAWAQSMIELFEKHGYTRAAAPSWQPIETAPKDGSCFLIYEGFEPTIESAWYDNGEVRACSNRDNFWHVPTHWMPTPAPPSDVIPAQSGREREADAAPREFMTHADEALWAIGEPSIKQTKSGANEQIKPVCKESFHTETNCQPYMSVVDDETPSIVHKTSSGSWADHKPESYIGVTMPEGYTKPVQPTVKDCLTVQNLDLVSQEAKVSAETNDECHSGEHMNADMLEKPENGNISGSDRMIESLDHAVDANNMTDPVRENMLDGIIPWEGPSGKMIYTWNDTIFPTAAKALEAKHKARAVRS